MDDLAPMLDRIARTVWTTALGLQIGRVPGDPLPFWEQPPLSASIDIRGEWNGTLLLSAPEALIRRFARILFGPEPAELGRAELEDTLGELVNIIGGNLKSCLPPPCQLSLPVQIPAGGAAEAPGGKGRSDVCRLSFVCEGEPLVVRVRQ